MKESNIASFMQKDLEIFSKKAGDKFKFAFYSELRILTKSGLDICSALNIITDNQSKSQQASIVKSIMEAVVEGKSFSSSLEVSGKFSAHEIAVIHIGEISTRNKSNVIAISIVVMTYKFTRRFIIITLIM